MLLIPYNRDFYYAYNNEPQIILETTITEVVKHARLLSFNLPSLCEVDYDAASNLYTFELVLLDTINIYDANASERDVRRLNHHYEHLKTKCLQQKDSLLEEYNICYTTYQNELAVYGVSSLNPEAAWLKYIEYCKAWQYFIFANIVFVNCSKANYDRRGRTCVVKFKIQY